MADQDLSQLKIDKSKAQFQPRRRKKYLSLALIAVALIFAGILYTQGIFTPAVEVQLATVSQIYPTQTFTTLNASGYVVPQRKASLASKVTGQLVWLGVEEGNRIEKDQLIARLESEDVKVAKKQALANVEAARFSLEQAKVELRDATLSLDRYKGLIQRGVIAQATYDTALARHEKAVAAVQAGEANVKASLAALESADVSIEYTLIRSPFDAIVLTKNADIGDIVTPIGAAANAKAAVVTIADIHSLQVEADVSESNLTRIKPGQPCEIQLDAIPGSRFRGAIHRIIPTADRTKATVMVKVRFIDKDPRILPEMSAKVAFLLRAPTAEDQKPKTAVSQTAVVNRKDRTIVFLVKEKKPVEVPVTLGEKIGEMVEVINGVKAGDQVVMNPPERLKTGSRIQVVEK